MLRACELLLIIQSTEMVVERIMGICSPEQSLNCERPLVGELTRLRLGLSRQGSYKRPLSSGLSQQAFSQSHVSPLFLRMAAREGKFANLYVK